MNLVLIGCLVVLLFSFVGNRRGVLRMLTFLFALLIAGLLAAPLGRTMLSLLGDMPGVPRTLAPLTALFVTGLAVFIVSDVLCNWPLRRRERRREEEALPRLRGWERLGGALLGALWGATLYILVLAGLHQLASVRQALEGAGVAPDPERKPKIDYTAVAARIDASPLASTVAAANPHDAKIARIFGNLATVTGDPVLVDRFLRHPAVAPLAENPELRRLTRDEEIRRLLDQRRYYELLDHPRLAALLKNRELVAACRQVDLDTVLREVLGRADRPTASGPHD